MKYYLGPWVWDNLIPGLTGWKPPLGAVGSIDLRSISEQALAGTFGTNPNGIFATESILGLEYEFLGEGDLGKITATDKIKDGWETKTGYRPIGSNLTEILWDQLTNGSDPSGALGVRPLMPTIAGDLELYFGNGKKERSEKFIYGIHPHTSKVREVLQIEFRKIWESGKETLAQKYLGSLTERKFKGVDWKEFVPIDLVSKVPGPIKPETTLTENFNTADSTTLGPAYSWVEAKDGVASDQFEVVSNQCQKRDVDSGTQGDSARAEADLSSDDHYAFVTVKAIGGATDNSQVGAVARYDSGADTFYVARIIQVLDTIELSKTAAGTITTIGVPVSITVAVDKIVKIQVDGSTIKSFWDGVEKQSSTDTTITGNTRAGIFGYHNETSQPGANPIMDDWEASDLEVVAATPAPTGVRKRRLLMGVGL